MHTGRLQNLDEVLATRGLASPLPRDAVRTSANGTWTRAKEQQHFTASRHADEL